MISSLPGKALRTLADIVRLAHYTQLPTSTLMFLFVTLGTSTDGTGAGNGTLLFISGSFSLSSFVLDDLEALVSNSELLLALAFFSPIKSRKKDHLY